MIKLSEPETPAFLKMGLFGNTATGKTYTAAKVLSQFIRDFCPDKRLAFFDTEPSAGYIKNMVLDITGKKLIAIHSRSFSDLVQFMDLCREEGHVALIDSITHPWRSLVEDYLTAKRSRVAGVGGNASNTKLSLKDWGPLKEMWGVFSSKFAWDPTHACIIGREGDVWETEEDEEGHSEMRKTGVKMKTETETGFEPSLLIQMRLINGQHLAYVIKDRFNKLTGQVSGNNPDIEFFMPHIMALDLGGSGYSENKPGPVFKNDHGLSLETIKVQRAAVLETVKDDMMLIYPGMTADDKTGRIKLLRKAFGTSSWTSLEADFKKYPLEALQAGLDIIQSLPKEEPCQEP